MEIPYSPELVRAFWLAAGGSILAAEHALKDRVAFNIGGGFHHAFPDHGEGFCMIHDVAVAIRRMQRDDKITRAMTVDCDVHQGNGTAAIFAGTRIPGAPLPSTAASVLNPSVKARGRTRGRRLHHLAASGKQLSAGEATFLHRRRPARWNRRRRLSGLAGQRPEFRDCASSSRS